MVALGDARRDDPDDALVPSLAGQDVGGPLARPRDLRLGLEEDPRLDVAAVGVEAVELVGDLGGAGLVGGQEQLQAGVGARDRRARPA